MINLDITYDRYVASEKATLINYRTEFNALQKSLDKTAKVLEANSEFINTNSTGTHEELIAFGQSVSVKNIKWHSDADSVKRDYLVQTAENHIQIRTKCRKIEFKLNKYQKAIVRKDIYKAVIRSFNLKLIQSMIEGYKFAPGFNCGTFQIVKRKRKFKSNAAGVILNNINWGESNKIKARLLDEGKTIYSKDNPEGERWFVYFTSEYELYWRWNKPHSSKDNYIIYAFAFTQSRSGCIKILNKIKAVNPNIHLRYQEI